MDPAVLDSFVRPSLVSTGVFLGICATVVALVLTGIARVAPAWRSRAVAVAAGWLALTAAAAYGIRGAELAVIPFFAASNLAAVALALSPVGKRLATLPVVALVGFQVFRLPLEMVLHDWYLGGSIPVQMSWSGQNIDVLSGIVAAALAALALRIELPSRALWGFQALGLGLLVNVARIAVQSAPTPLRQFPEDPPLLLAWFVPYTWIVTVCVAGALAGHLVLLRKQLGR